MQKPEPQKTKKLYKQSDDLPVDEMVDAMIELLGERPDYARRVKARAEAGGLSFDVALWKVVADGMHGEGVPLPPQMRKHIAEHPDMPEALRRKLLARDLN